MKKIFILCLTFTMLPGCGACLSSFIPKAEEKQANLKDKKLYKNIKSQDFDLEAVVALIKQNKVKDMTGLEKLINSNSNAINNVDTDKDGKVDYVLVKEKRENNNKNMNFEFFAKANKAAEPVKIADVNFEIGPKRINIAGNYDNNIADSDKSYRTTVVNNHNGPSWGQMFFFAWLMRPSRPMFYQPYYPSHYRPHNVYPDRVVNQKRQRYSRASGLGRVSSYRNSNSPTKKPGFFKNLGKKIKQRRSGGFKPKFRGFRGFRRR